jgi:DNA repair protein RecO (recombination protein O)
MQWTDQAIVLSTRKFSENSGIVSVFTYQHGRAKGLVRQISGRSQRGTYQLGNIITTSWSARLAEQLGYFQSELVQPIAAFCLSEPLRLLGLSATCALLDITLAEREAHPILFETTLPLIQKIIMEKEWVKDYVSFEILLLQELGFRLELECCVATGKTEDLIYVSPKSGRAVSATAGQPYKDKLLPLPQFLLPERNSLPTTLEDIKNGLELGAYFLNKYMLSAHALAMPNARTRLYESILKQTIALSV